MERYDEEPGQVGGVLSQDRLFRLIRVWGQTSLSRPANDSTKLAAQASRSLGKDRSDNAVRGNRRDRARGQVDNAWCAVRAVIKARDQVAVI